MSKISLCCRSYYIRAMAIHYMVKGFLQSLMLKGSQKQVKGHFIFEFFFVVLESVVRFQHSGHSGSFLMSISNSLPIIDHFSGSWI